MAIIHISESEAVRTFANLLTQVRAGAEIVIEHEALPIAVLRPAEQHQFRSIDESLAMAEANEEASHTAPAMDENFAADMEDILRGRRPRTSTWE